MRSNTGEKRLRNKPGLEEGAKESEVKFAQKRSFAVKLSSDE